MKALRSASHEDDPELSAAIWTVAHIAADSNAAKDILPGAKRTSQGHCSLPRESNCLTLSSWFS